MDAPASPRHVTLVGRTAELERLDACLRDAAAGKGLTVVISGEPGIGKTRLVEAMKSSASSGGVRILSGAAAPDSAVPFLAISSALETAAGRPLFREQEHVSFQEVFAVDVSGNLLAKSSFKEGYGATEMDAGTFTGMLSAVQSFVADSFGHKGMGGADPSGPLQGAGLTLGRMEYGEMKILVEHGRHVFLTGVIDGEEHPEMRDALRRTVERVEDKFGGRLGKPDGNAAKVTGVQAEMESLRSRRFLARKKLEGVKLDSERARIAEDALKQLCEMSMTGPLLLVLEDIHWADESSLFVLAYLARNIGSERIAVIATARTGEGRAFQASLGKMRADGTIREIVLDRLEPGEVSDLLGSAYSPNDFPSGLAQRIESDCAGNPFFIVEALRQMLHDGGIAFANGVYTLVREDYTISSTIDGLVQRRLDSLDPDAMSLAEYAACIGREFDIQVAKSNASLRDIDEALRKLIESGIMSRKEVSGARLQFSHAYFHSVLYGNLTPRWKSSHHRSIGEHYERIFQGRLDDAAYELAHHFSRCAEYEKGYLYSLKAGELAESAYSPEQAIALYEQALALLPKTRDPNPSKEAMLCERLGDVHTLSGNYDPALSSFQRALDAASSSETRARMHRKRGKVLESKGEYDTALVEAEKGISLAGKSAERWRIDLVKARVLQQRGHYPVVATLCERAVHGLKEHAGTEGDVSRALIQWAVVEWLTGKYDDALVRYGLSLALAEKAKDERLVATTLANMAIVYCDKGDYGEAMARYRSALDINMRMGNQWGMASCHGGLGVVHQRMGNLLGAREEMENCLRIYQKIGDSYGIGLSFLNLGIFYADMGDLDEAERRFEKSLAMGERIGNPLMRGTSIYMLGGIHQERGDLARALDGYGESNAIFERTGDMQRIAGCLGSIASVKMEAGELESALEACVKSLKISKDMQDMEGIISATLIKSEILLDKGDVDEALSLCLEAEKMAGESNTRQYHAHALMDIGIIESRTGRHEPATQSFRKGYGELTECKALVERAKLSFRWGEALLRGGEREEGIGMLRQALAFFEERGMAPWVERCRKSLEARGVGG
ncbi:MAG: tetratricopeptide repeat protein [Euryarchaeota archaeon]|nr:tetratricopeptide repeat protein [Euryarchaeota archaeon]